MGLLEDAWADVSRGNGPRVVALVAEQGLGKTRLVVEFYGRLVRAAGAGGYWPAALGREGDTLAINPPAGACDHASALPFLWWGVRLSDPGAQEQVATGALPGHVEAHLVPHLEPLAREQRRRQARLQLMRLGGSLAADFAVDALASTVPLLGLVKKATEVGAELRGIHAGYRQDAAPFDAAAFGAQRRASLVEQVCTDLGRLFDGPTGRRVPAVIVVDDAQFSAADPTVTALVSELLKRMYEGRWPVLLLLTHWEREWQAAELALEAAADAAPTGVGGVALLHGRRVLGGLDVVRLRPLDDLGPALAAGLPGLDPAQREELALRAGGNPRLLEEVVRYARSPRGAQLFVGGDRAGALTEAGLGELVRRGTRFEELVADRLAAAPAAVQQALALAALQGSDFMPELAGLTAAELTGDHAGATAAAATEGLRLAEGSYGYVEATGPATCSFRQRVYLTAARELLAGLIDERLAEEALAGAVRRVLTDREAMAAWPARMPLLAQAARLFSQADDPEDARLAAAALHGLLLGMRAAGDLLAAAEAARRLARVLAALPDESLDADLAWPLDAVGALSSVGAAADVELCAGLLRRLAALTAESLADDVNAWTVRMHASVMLHVHEHHLDLGAQEAADDALQAAVDTMALLPAEEYDLEAALVARDLHNRRGDWHMARAQLAPALEAYTWALVLAEAALERQDGAPGARWLVAVGRRKLGRCQRLLGDAEAAAQHLEAAAAELRALWAETADPGAATQLAATLDELADARLAEGDHHGGIEFLLESHAIVFEQQRVAPEAFEPRANLADACARLARAYLGAEAAEEAYTYATQAVEHRRANAQASPSRLARADLGYACTLGAQASRAVGRTREAVALSKEALDLQLAHAGAYPPAAAAWLRLSALAVRIPVVRELEGEAAARALLHHVDAAAATLAPEEAAAMETLLLELAELRAALGAQLGGAAS